MSAIHDSDELLGKVSELEEYYHPVGRGQSVAMGQFELLESEQSPGTLIARKTFATRGKKEALEIIRGASRRLELSHIGLLRMLDYSVRKGSDRFEVSGYYEFVPKNLEQEIGERAASGRPFQPGQLDLLFERLVGASAFLESARLAHGDLRPALVGLTEEGFKLLDRLQNPAEPPRSLRRRLRAGEKVYASPEALESARTRGQTPFSQFKSEAFALGVVLLEAAGLAPVAGLDPASIQTAVKAVQTKVSHRFFQGLQMLLEPEEKKRKDPRQVATWLQAHRAAKLGSLGELEAPKPSAKAPEETPRPAEPSEEEREKARKEQLHREQSERTRALLEESERMQSRLAKGPAPLTQVQPSPQDPTNLEASDEDSPTYVMPQASFKNTTPLAPSEASIAQTLPPKFRDLGPVSAEQTPLAAGQFTKFPTPTPQQLNPSTPQHLNPSTPQHLNTSTPQHLNTSTPQQLNPSIGMNLAPYIANNLAANTREIEQKIATDSSYNRPPSPIQITVNPGLKPKEGLFAFKSSEGPSEYIKSDRYYEPTASYPSSNQPVTIRSDAAIPRYSDSFQHTIANSMPAQPVPSFRLTPQPLNSSTAQQLNSSTPQQLNSSTAQASQSRPYTRDPKPSGLSALQRPQISVLPPVESYSSYNPGMITAQYKTTSSSQPSSKTPPSEARPSYKDLPTPQAVSPYQQTTYNANSPKPTTYTSSTYQPPTSYVSSNYQASSQPATYTFSSYQQNSQPTTYTSSSYQPSSYTSSSYQPSPQPPTTTYTSYQPTPQPLNPSPASDAFASMGLKIRVVKNNSGSPIGRRYEDSQQSSTFTSETQHFEQTHNGSSMSQSYYRSN